MVCAGCHWQFYVTIVNPTRPGRDPGDWKPRRPLWQDRCGLPERQDSRLRGYRSERGSCRGAVAAGHLLAAEKGRIGERYILGGRNMTLKQILDALALIAGLPSPRLRLPHAVALAAGYADEIFSRLTGREPQGIPVEGVKMSRHRMFVASDKAERELGYKTGPVERALESSVRWYRDQGYIHGRAGTKPAPHAQAA